jgi:hypothetical protein
MQDVTNTATMLNCHLLFHGSMADSYKQGKDADNFLKAVS